MVDRGGRGRVPYQSEDVLEVGGPLPGGIRGRAAGRSSAPRRVANRTPQRRVETIKALRRLRFTGPEIAELLDMPLSTVSGILTRIGLGKLGRLGFEPATALRTRPTPRVDPHRRQESRAHRPRHRQADLRRPLALHRFVHRRRRPRPPQSRLDFAHIAIDDATRLAYAEVLPDEQATTAIGFLRRALAFYASYGITAECVLTDNGSPYRSTVHAIACRALGIRHLRTRPRRPQTNGKAERFIRTMLGGWAYGAIYASSRERTATLDGWLYHYNHHRSHAGIGRHTPITRLNNLLGTYS